MTNVSRKGVWAIVLGSLAVATLIFFAWATSGFRNWNAESWFNYWWGLTKPAVVRVADQPKANSDTAAMVMTSADTSLVLDSDDAQLTAEVKKFPTPVLEQDNVGVYFKVSLSTLNVSFFESDIYIPLYVTFQSKDLGLYSIELELLDFDEGFLWTDLQFKYFEHGFKDFGVLPSGLYLMYAEVGACEEFDILGSDLLVGNVWIPPVELLRLDNSIFMDGTTVKVNMPYDYGHYFSSVGVANSINKRLSIDIFDYVENPNDLKATPAYSLNGTGLISYYDYSEDFATDLTNPFTLHTEENGKHYYEIDLTKLNFVNTPHPACAIRVSTVWTSTATNDKAIPDYIFHPFAAKTYSNNFYGHLNFAVEKLATPQNLTYNFGSLSWDEVQGAFGYAVFDGDNSWTVDTNSITLPGSALTSGEHIFRVRALGNVGQALSAVDNGVQLSAYNASSNITQLVTLTYNINGDTVTKFVPLGSKLSDYTYDVNISGKEFGGWYYDDGFSRKVEPADVLAGDTVIYARLSDKKIVESKKPSWWNQYKWYVYGGLIGLAVLGLVATVVVGIRKKKAA